MTVGERIKQLREERGLSQDELAKMSGYGNRSSISTIESLPNERITLKKVQRIAKALNVSSAYLMGWTDEVEVSDQDIINQLSNDQLRRVMLYAKFIMENEK